MADLPISRAPAPLLPQALLDQVFETISLRDAHRIVTALEAAPLDEPRFPIDLRILAVKVICLQFSDPQLDRQTAGLMLSYAGICEEQGDHAEAASLAGHAISHLVKLKSPMQRTAADGETPHFDPLVSRGLKMFIGNIRQVRARDGDAAMREIVGEQDHALMRDTRFARALKRLNRITATTASDGLSPASTRGYSAGAGMTVAPSFG